MRRVTSEHREEAGTACAANRAAQRLLSAKHRIETGEVDLELIPALDDAERNDPKFQAELKAFSKSLYAVGVPSFQKTVALDAGEDGGYPLAEFVLKDFGVSLVAGAAHVCAVWVKARYGRRLRIKLGDMIADGQTNAEIKHLLKQAAEFAVVPSRKSREK